LPNGSVVATDDHAWIKHFDRHRRSTPWRSTHGGSYCADDVIDVLLAHEGATVLRLGIGREDT
jgi:hypothetical protein